MVVVVQEAVEAVVAGFAEVFASFFSAQTTLKTFLFYFIIIIEDVIEKLKLQVLMVKFCLFLLLLGLQ